MTATIKLNIESLFRDLTIDENDGRISINNKEIDLLWLQGIITWLDSDLQQLNLEDESGSVMIDFSSINEEQQRRLSENQYIMVQGTVCMGFDEETQQKTLFLEAWTINDLSHDAKNLRSLWSFEVKEVQRILFHD